MKESVKYWQHWLIEEKKEGPNGPKLCRCQFIKKKLIPDSTHMAIHVDYIKMRHCIISNSFPRLAFEIIHITAFSKGVNPQNFSGLILISLPANATN